MPDPDLAGVVLAAGLGTRLRPLTDLLPKCLCPVNNVALLDLAIDSVRRHTTDVAVNVHYLADVVQAHLSGSGVHISDERERILASGGALGHLHDWIDGRPVLVRNADSYLTDDLSGLLDGWTGERPRLLVRDTGGPADFGDYRYLGACLVPAATAAALPDRPCGLYHLVWVPAWEDGTLEFVEAVGDAVDCGTAADYLRANLLASGGASVVGDGATVDGTLTRSVVWPGGYVAPHEHLVDVIRAGWDITVAAG